MKKKIYYIQNDSRGRAVYEDEKGKQYLTWKTGKEKNVEIITAEERKPVTEEYDFVYVPVYMDGEYTQNKTAEKILCPFCGKATSIYFTRKEMENYRRYSSSRWSNTGTVPHIQDLFPKRTKEERELMITGYCYRCQNIIFGIEQFPLLAEPEFLMEENGLIAYNRSDHDGHCWWSNWFPKKGTGGNQEMIREMEEFRDYLLEDMLGKGISDIPKLAEYVGVSSSEDKEYPLYCQGEHCNYKVRLVNRQKDYNVYIYVYDILDAG